MHNIIMDPRVLAILKYLCPRPALFFFLKKKKIVLVKQCFILRK